MPNTRYSAVNRSKSPKKSQYNKDYRHSNSRSNGSKCPPVARDNSMRGGGGMAHYWPDNTRFVSTYVYNQYEQKRNPATGPRIIFDQPPYSAEQLYMPPPPPVSPGGPVARYDYTNQIGDSMTNHSTHSHSTHTLTNEIPASMNNHADPIPSAMNNATAHIPALNIPMNQISTFMCNSKNQDPVNLVENEKNGAAIKEECYYF